MHSLTERLERRSGEEMESLLARCGRGDERAWPSLLAEVRQASLELARWRYRLSADDAEDVAQVVQLRVAGRLKQLKQSGAFPVWMRRVVHHAVLDHLRQRRQFLSLEELVEPGAERPIEAEQPDAFEQVVLRADLSRALEHLPDHFREPIRLHLLQGLPQDEVGRLLGRPRSTVASQIERGLRRLQRSLSGIQPAGC